MDEQKEFTICDYKVPIMPPEDILPDLLRAKCIKAIQCLHSVQPQVIERIVPAEDVEELLERHRSEELIGPIERSLYGIADLKEKLVIEDIKTLSDRINKQYIKKLKQLGTDPTCHQDLWQVVEIDWTFQDLCPGDEALHYRIFTKREICIRNLEDANG